MVRSSRLTAEWCHPAGSACKSQQYPKIHSPLPVHSYGEKCCVPNPPALPAPGPKSGTEQALLRAVALGLHVWQTAGGTGEPCGFQSSGSQGTAPAEKQEPGCVGMSQF